MDVIDYLIPRSSFIIDKFKYQFKDIKCTREEVRVTYYNDKSTIELIYAHENRAFFCIVENLKTKEQQNWQKLPPSIHTITELSDLENKIDEWLTFLKSEL